MAPVMKPLVILTKLIPVKRVVTKSSNHYEKLAYKRLKERMTGQTSSKPDTVEKQTVANKAEDPVLLDCRPKVILNEINGPIN
jgi:hypothetical protein